MTTHTRLLMLLLSFLMMAPVHAKGDKVRDIKSKISSFAQKVIGAIEMTLDQDQAGGEFIELKIHTKLKLDIGDLAYYPHKFSSYVSFSSNGENKDLVLRVYTKDLENFGVGEELQTSEGRAFPKFIDGVKYESIYGEEIKTKNSFIHLYFDGEKRMFGMFIPTPFVGTTITKANELLAKIPVIGSLIPKINSVPVNIKIKKQKIGRVSLLSADSEGNNSGVVMMFDHEQLKEVLRNK